MKMKRSLLIVAAAAASSIVLSLNGVSTDATSPGENGRIAYRLYLNAKQTRAAIFTINPDGSDRQQVTHPRRGVLHLSPDWSSDGRWIVYVRTPTDRLAPRLWRVEPDGTGGRRVSRECTARIGCIIEDDPAWSPDGRRIAFIRAYEKRLHHGSEVMIMRADGTHVRPVTQHSPGRDIQDWQVQWAPTGDRLVFQRVKALSETAIFTVNPDGTDVQRITPWMGAYYPDWSPDGQWILFTAPLESPNDFWMVHADGSELHEITTDVPDVHWLLAAFSPDGSMIVFSRTPGIGEAGNADVYVMNMDGSGVQDITNSGKWDSSPDWGPLET